MQAVDYISRLNPDSAALTVLEILGEEHPSPVTLDELKSDSRLADETDNAVCVGATRLSNNGLAEKDDGDVVEVEITPEGEEVLEAYTSELDGLTGLELRASQLPDSVVPAASVEEEIPETSINADSWKISWFNSTHTKLVNITDLEDGRYQMWVYGQGGAKNLFVFDEQDFDEVLGEFEESPWFIVDGGR